MASVEWRRIPTVLRTDEILDKAFRRASKQGGMEVHLMLKPEIEVPDPRKFVM